MTQHSVSIVMIYLPSEEEVPSAILPDTQRMIHLFEKRFHIRGSVLGSVVDRMSICGYRTEVLLESRTHALTSIPAVMVTMVAVVILMGNSRHMVI